MPIQTLKLADDLFPDVLAERKTNTICSGHREIETRLVFEPTSGKELLDDDGDPYISVLVKVESVKHCLFRELTLEDLQREGITTSEATFVQDLQNFLDGMRRFYPDMTMDSPVTVINFEFLRRVVNYTRPC
mgnify:CR=1 FL=1